MPQLLYRRNLREIHPAVYEGGLSDGKDGTFQTLKMMAQLVRFWKRNAGIRQLAINLCSGLQSKDYVGEVNALFEYVRDHIRYVQDVADIETLHTPDVVLGQGAGDCDDKSMLLATMLESIGHKCRFVAMSWHGPNAFEHVSVETLIGTVWVNLETTEPVNAGWYPDPPPTDTLRVYC